MNRPNPTKKPGELGGATGRANGTSMLFTCLDAFNYMRIAAAGQAMQIQGGQYAPKR